MNINFPEEIKSSVIKRQAEYLAGRYAARSALNHLGVESARQDHYKLNY
jgi:4'-phosphopantetheinyl transferase EntD